MEHRCQKQGSTGAELGVWATEGNGKLQKIFSTFQNGAGYINSMQARGKAPPENVIF